LAWQIVFKAWKVFDRTWNIVFQAWKTFDQAWNIVFEAWKVLAQARKIVAVAPSVIFESSSVFAVASTIVDGGRRSLPGKGRSITINPDKLGTIHPSLIGGTPFQGCRGHPSEVALKKRKPSVA